MSVSSAKSLVISSSDLSAFFSHPEVPSPKEEKGEEGKKKKKKKRGNHE